MSSILADQWRPRMWAQCGGIGGGEGCGASANEYSCTHGAQINFGDLTPYLTNGYYTTSTLLGIHPPPPPHHWCRSLELTSKAQLLASRHPISSKLGPLKQLFFPIVNWQHVYCVQNCKMHGVHGFDTILELFLLYQSTSFPTNIKMQWKLTVLIVIIKWIA